MGVAALLSCFREKSEVDRRIMINLDCPSLGRQQGGCWRRVAPSSRRPATTRCILRFYLAMILVLATLWLRPLGADYRAKIDNPA
ncbi:hypothetical protein O9993_22800 [Vibrio lentus]|nr:hypothetical protein [Vibrio lentus]